MRWQFWKWLFCGLESAPGIQQFKIGWLMIHAATGVGLAFLIDEPLSEASRVILLPLTGLLVGISFAWIGNALTLLRSDEIAALSEHHVDGLRSYVYTFQTAVLVIMVTAGLWAGAGLKMFDLVDPSPATAIALESGLYFFAALATREAWQVVMGSQELLLTRSFIRQNAPPSKSDSSAT